MTYVLQVAVLCQCLGEIDYCIAYKSLQEPVCSDAMDIFYQYIWDVNILEFLISIFLSLKLCALIFIFIAFK